MIPTVRIEPNGWARVGTRAPFLWSRGRMRIERVPEGFRAWDGDRTLIDGPPLPTTFHRTLREAKARCEKEQP